jgi:hypothetical protein
MLKSDAGYFDASRKAARSMKLLASTAGPSIGVRFGRSLWSGHAPVSPLTSRHRPRQSSRRTPVDAVESGQLSVFAKIQKFADERGRHQEGLMRGS